MAKLNIHDDIDIPKVDKPLKINEYNNIMIHGWMRTILDLKSSELVVYAIIYGFSQDGESEFFGSRQYLADWVGCSVKTIERVLNNLVDTQLINKRVVTKNNVNYPHYSVNFETLFTLRQNDVVVRQNDVQLLLNNNKYNIYNNNDIVRQNDVGGTTKCSKAIFNELKSKTNSKYSTKNVIDDMFSHYEKLYTCKYPESNFSKLTSQIQKLQKDYNCTLNELSTKIIAWMDFWKSSDWQQEEGNFVLPSALWIRNKLDAKVGKDDKKSTPPAYYEGQKVNTYDSNNNRRK